MNEKFMRLPEVCEAVGLKKSTIWLYVREGKFPKQIKLAPRVSVWKESDINNWIKETVAKAG